MYAHLIRIKTKPDRMDKFLSGYCNEVIPALTEEPGFRDGVVLSAGPTNSGFVVTMWDSEATLEGSEHRNQGAIDSSLRQYLAAEPKPEWFEVLVQAGRESAGLCARAITLPVPGKHIESALQIYKEEYLPLLEAQPGFLRVMWLANRVNGTGWGISYWSSHEQMQAADQEGEFFPKVLARLATYFSAPPEMGYYAVDVHV